MKFAIVVSVIIGSIIIVICAFFVWMWMAKQKGINKKKLNMNQVKLEELPLFKFEKLAIATENFDETNKLGHGGFGPVYKGKLYDGQEIAVKRLSRSSEQGLEEFMNECKPRKSKINPMFAVAVATSKPRKSRKSSTSNSSNHVSRKPRKSSTKPRKSVATSKPRKSMIQNQKIDLRKSQRVNPVIRNE
ncbi:hypothetical protein Vadar_011139 [Vaccinium darrowii]|uniref:Uncharacterized protein n=1 Tax=Vaccinium darrowii TaxID=229202 RepID=A0ACB7X9E1_9ERIC|nr:hypothetical protein Vadar_011139 [Vaccinium darrowii]